MKKRKSSILIILFVITITLISMFGFSNMRTQAYDHNPTNILNNVFKKGQTTVLPFIFDDVNDEITKTYLISEFEKANIQIKNKTTLPKIISTGTIIETEGTDYTVVIYGDVNGDGKITVFDAQSVFDHWATNTDFSGTAFKLAANVYNNDSKITVYDAQAIFDFWMENTTKLVLNEPTNADETPSSSYVTGIKITKSPTKISYMDGDAISLDGIVVKEVYADGTEDVVANTLLSSNLTTAQYGKNTIAVRYTTTNTIDGTSKVFEDTFNITIGRNLTTVNISSVSNNVKGLCYDTIPAVALKSGDDEVKISASDNFSYTIYKNNVEVFENEATIIPGGNVGTTDAQVILSLKAKTKGEYKIVLNSVNGITNTAGMTKGVTVNVEENNTINIITLTDINDETKKYEVRRENNQAITNSDPIKLAVGKTSRFYITFGHAYVEDGKVDRTAEIPVTYSKISNPVSYIKFANAAGDVTGGDADGEIKRLTVIPTTNEFGNTTLPITVNGATYSFKVEVSENNKQIIIPTTITFKTTEIPGESKKVDGDIYTLLPIKFDDSTSIARTDINNNIITITYNEESCEESFDVFVKYFYEDNGVIKEQTSGGQVDYLGFAKDPDHSIVAPIKITYKGTLIEITVVP